MVYIYSNVTWATTWENLSLRVCEQHRRWPDCTFAQSGQRLCYSLFCKVTYVSLVQVKFQFSSKSLKLRRLVWNLICRKPRRQVFWRRGPHNDVHNSVVCNDKILTISCQKWDFKVILMSFVKEDLTWILLYYLIFLTHCEKVIKCSANLTFYHFSPPCLINSIIQNTWAFIYDEQDLLSSEKIADQDLHNIS